MQSWERQDGEPEEDYLRRMVMLVKAYEEAIRKHRDQRGDDRCFLDDIDLYKVLPEGYDASSGPQLDSPDVMLENCRRFVASRHNPSCLYTSPQREIERLEARVVELEKVLRIEE